MLCQLSYTHHQFSPGQRAVRHMARLEGIEPTTYGLEIRCSIQLSYRRNTETAPGSRGRVRVAGQPSAETTAAQNRCGDRSREEAGRGERI